jgi:hypothetical protein
MTVKSTGQIASTETASFQGDLDTLFGSTDTALESVENIHLEDEYGATESYRITGFSRGADAVIFYTARGVEAIRLGQDGTITVVDATTRRQLKSNKDKKFSSKRFSSKKDTTKKKDGSTKVASKLSSTLGGVDVSQLSPKEQKQLFKLVTGKKSGSMALWLRQMCAPTSIDLNGDDAEEHRDKAVSAEVVTSYLLTVEWPNVPGSSELGVNFEENETTATQFPSASASTTTGRQLVYQAPFDQLKDYYLAEAAKIFTYDTYPGMCYDSAYLTAQLDWCVGKGHIIGSNNYTAVITCVEDYFASLGSDGSPPAALDPASTQFNCPVSSVPSGRRLSNRRRLTGDGASCHPAHATVELASGATTRMDALRVGDEIRTPSGFEPVVGFLHADAKAYNAYHVLTTDNGRTIEISDNHWLMVDRVEADPAMAKVGQRLTTTEGEQTIVSIFKADRAGAYHLVTASGQYYVDGVLASTYVAYIPRSMWSVFGDGYITLRYALGVPLVPDGQSTVPLFWFLDTMKALAIPAPLQVSVFWLPLVASVVLSELVSALIAHLPMTASFLALTLVAATPMAKRRATA